MSTGPERKNRVERRRERIRSEIRRNREGGHKIPTWVLAVLVAVLVIGWIYLVVSQ